MKKLAILTFLVGFIFAFSYRDLCKKLPNTVYEYKATSGCEGMDMSINDITSSQASKEYASSDKTLEVMIVKGSFAMQYLPLISQNVSVTTNGTKLYTTNINGKKAVFNVDLHSKTVQLAILTDEKTPELLIINLNGGNEKEAERIAKEILAKF